MNPSHVDFYIQLHKSSHPAAWRLIYRGYSAGAGELETLCIEAGLSCAMRTVPAGTPPADGVTASQFLGAPDMGLWKRWERENVSQAQDRCTLVQVPRTLVRPLDRMMTWGPSSLGPYPLSRDAFRGARHEDGLVDAAQHVGRLVEPVGYSVMYRGEESYQRRMVKEALAKAKRVLSASTERVSSHGVAAGGLHPRGSVLAERCAEEYRLREAAEKAQWPERWTNQELKARSARKTLEFTKRYKRPEDPNKDS